MVKLPPTTEAGTRPGPTIGCMLERETRFELATLYLGSKCSANCLGGITIRSLYGTFPDSWQPKACSGYEASDPGLADHGYLSRTFHRPFAVVQNAASRASDAQNRQAGR